MKIGLVDVDHKKKRRGAAPYPNLALCKIARYHKEQGDTVEWATQLEHYDILYMSKVFNFTPDDTSVYDAEKVVKGGTGYDIHSQLPREIDSLQPDYSIYPDIAADTAYGFLTRGCPNHCAWCVVPKKEGVTRVYNSVDQIAIEGRKKLILMDNNFLALQSWSMLQLATIISRGYRVDFNQGLDARLVDEDNAKLLAKVKWIHGRVRFACDTPVQIGHCERAMQLLINHGFKGEFFIYTIVGAPGSSFNRDFARINHWWTALQKYRNGCGGFNVYCHTQPYRDPMKVNCTLPQWQKDMAGWCNKRMLFTTIPFGEFSPRKGFKCIQYFNDLTI